MAKPLYGQVAVSGTPQVLTGTATEVQAFTVKAPRSNTNPVFLGDASVTLLTGHQLDPGDQFEYERSQQNGQPVYQLKPSDFFVVGTGPDRVSWLASPLMARFALDNRGMEIVPNPAGLPGPPGPSGGLPSGTTAQTLIVDHSSAPHFTSPPEISLKAFGAVGNGIADDTAAVQSWINAVVSSNGQTGKAEAGTYKTTAITGVGLGLSGAFAGFKLKGEPGCSFQFAGVAGSGPGFGFYDCQGSVEGINFTFLNGSYNGNLVDVDHGAQGADPQMKFFQCGFGVRVIQTPRCMLRLNRVICTTVRECHFWGGQYAIMLGDGGYIIANSIRDCVFNNSALGHIWVSGGSNEANIIDGCTFESRADGSAGSIICDPGIFPRALSITGNWFGDVSVGGSAQIVVTSAYIAGNRLYGSGYGFKILPNGFTVIEHNDVQVIMFDPASSAMTGCWRDNGGAFAPGDAVMSSNNVYLEGFNADTTGYIPTQTVVQSFVPTGMTISTNTPAAAHASGLVGYSAHTIAPASGNSNLGAIGFDSTGSIWVRPASSGQYVLLLGHTGGNLITARNGHLGFFNKAAIGSEAAQPVLSYSRSGAGETAAVAAIRVALAALGLVLDSTTA